jgi:hypothetical protein
MVQCLRISRIVAVLYFRTYSIPLLSLLLMLSCSTDSLWRALVQWMPPSNGLRIIEDICHGWDEVVLCVVPSDDLRRRSMHVYNICFSAPATLETDEDDET